MNRRNFIQVTAGTVASLALPVENAEAQQPAVPQSADVTVSVTGNLTQDFVFGTPWTLRSGVNGIDVPMLCRDHSQQILSLPYNIERSLYRLHPDVTNATGWTFDKTPLPNLAYLPGIVYTAVLAPGTPDRLLIYQQNSVLSAVMDEHGKIEAGFNATTSRLVTRPLVRGTLPPNSRYVPEVPDQLRSNIHDFYSPPHINDALLRDVTSIGLPVKFVERGAIDVATTQVIPLANSGANVYRCVVLDPNQDVRWLVLGLDEATDTFRIREQHVLGKSATGCVHVHEHAAGAVEVVLMEPSAVLTFSGRFDQDSIHAATWTQFPPAPITNFELVTKSPVPIRFYSHWDPASRTLEAYFAVFSAQNDPAQNIYAVPDLYWCTRSADGTWNAMTLLETRCDPLGFLVDGTLCTSRVYTGYELRQRGAVVNHIYLQAPGERATETSSFRVGIEFARNNTPLAAQSVEIATSHPAVCLVNGVRSIPGQSRPSSAVTDPTGTLWVTVFAPDRLTFPSLIVSSPLFDRRLSLDLNQKIRQRLSGLSAQQLLDGADPVDRSKLFVGSSDAANDVSTAIRNIAAYSPTPASGIGAPARVKLTSAVAATWVPLAVTAAQLQPRPVNAGTTWTLNSAGNTPRLSTVSKQTVEDQIRREQARSSGNIFDQIKKAVTDAWDMVKGWVSAGIDYLGDIASAVKNGIAKVANVIVDGVKITLTLVVKGLVYVYEGALETVAQVMRAINYIVDVVGMVAGKFLRWLLDLFFDWDAILRKRDEVRRLFTNGVGLITRSAPDPKQLTDAITSELGSLQSSLRDILSKGSGYAASFSLPGGSLPSIPSFPDQTGWLLEKLQGALSVLLPDYDLPSFPSGLTPAMVNRMSSSVETLGSGMSGLQDAFQRFADGRTSPSNFTQELLDAVASQLDGLIAAFREIIGIVGDALHNLWTNPQRMLAWLDSELPLPGIRTFYQALFDHHLSPLDVMCSLAAITLVATGQKSTYIAGAPRRSFEENANLRILREASWAKPRFHDSTNDTDTTRPRRVRKWRRESSPRSRPSLTSSIRLSLRLAPVEQLRQTSPVASV